MAYPYSKQMKPRRDSSIIKGHSLGPAGGLVGFWGMMPWETGGTTVFDLSGSGNHLTLTGGPVWSVSDKYSPSILFSGTSQYLNIEKGIVYVEPFSMVCWFRTHNNDKDQNLMFTGNAASGDWHGIQIYGTSPFPVRVMSYDGGFSASSVGAISNNVWYMAAGVWASDKSRIAYLDDVAGTEETTSRTVGATSRFRIGCETYGTTGDFDGDIALAMIWNRALSSSEIALLYRESFCMFKDSNEWSILGGYTTPVEGNAGIMTLNTGYWGPTF